MSRSALLSCSLLLVACGADKASKVPTKAIAPAVEEGQRTAVKGGVRSLALYRGPEGSALSLVSLGEELQRIQSGQASAVAGAISAPLFVDVQGSSLWLASHQELQELDTKELKRRQAISLPEGTQVRAIEVGYQGVVFLADTEAMRVSAASPSSTQTLIEGEALGHPQALLLNGGSLIIGTDKKLLGFNLKSGEIKVLSEELGSVVALAHDHLGYFVAANSAGEIYQVQGEGESRRLLTLAAPATAMAFDPKERRLHLGDASGLLSHDYLQLTGEDHALWASRDQRLMRPFHTNGVTVAGGEYWPSHGTTNVSYPEDILWGFYPSPDEVHEGSAAKVAPPPAAIACAEKSYRALQAFVDSSPEAFHQAAEARKASKQFYLWVNDYSDAAADFPHEQRPSKFWYWERKPAVTGRVPGFWKWETTLMQDGSCSWPQADQIDAYLKATLAGEK